MTKPRSTSGAALPRESIAPRRRAPPPPPRNAPASGFVRTAPKATPRPSPPPLPLASFDDVDTSVLTLSPELLASLRRIAPRTSRSSKRVYLGICGVIAAALLISGQPSAREFVSSRWHAAWAGRASH
jgi:hypothetical protein